MIDLLNDYVKENEQLKIRCSKLEAMLNIQSELKNGDVE